jgi:hypothetical protein
MVPSMADEPREALRKAAEAALGASDRLYELAGEQIDVEEETDEATDERIRATEFLQEAAHEIRRHALWLYAETEIGAFSESPEGRR